MDYSKINYKNTCLTQVIVRLDFLEFLDSVNLFSDTVEKILLPNFPKKGMQQLIRFQSMNLTVDPKGAKTERLTRDGLQQEFVNSDGNKIVLSNKFVVLEINKYSNYENELGKFTPVLKAIMTGTQLTAIRTGIRYINEFGKDTIKPQKNYFSSPASDFVDIKLINEQKVIPIRAMALNEYVVEDMHLNFRYGQYNPQYPQPMNQMKFVLDFDCFCDEALKGIDSMIEHINKGHDVIQELFEESITDKLKRVMSDG